MILSTVFELQGEHKGKYEAVAEFEDGRAVSEIRVFLVFYGKGGRKTVQKYWPQALAAGKYYLEMQLDRKVSA